MDANPSTVARTTTSLRARRAATPAPPSSRLGERRPADLMTVDPEDRRRRARVALLDLAIQQAMRQ